MERQRHGFTYEDIKRKEYGLTKYENYTAPFDAYDENYNYQIKFQKKGSAIELGDYFRNSEKDTDFYLIVGFYEGNRKDIIYEGENSSIVEEYILFIPVEVWKEHTKFDKKEELRNWIKNIVSNDRSYNERWKKEKSHYKKEWDKIEGRKINLRFKRDSKNQRRIQCAINNSDFYNYFNQFVVESVGGK